MGSTSPEGEDVSRAAEPDKGVVVPVENDAGGERGVRELGWRAVRRWLSTGWSASCHGSVEYDGKHAKALFQTEKSNRWVLVGDRWAKRSSRRQKPIHAQVHSHEGKPPACAEWKQSMLRLPVGSVSSSATYEGVVCNGGHRVYALRRR